MMYDGVSVSDITERTARLKIIAAPKQDDLPTFVEEPDEKYVCLQCEHVLRPPVQQTPCGHRFCSQCVEALFQGAETVMCPGREEDCVTFTQQQLHVDNATKRDLMRLEVYCTYKDNGCPDVIKWAKLLVHVNACAFRALQCPNEGCPLIILIKDLDQHEKECEYIAIRCENCNSEVPKREMESHLRECLTKAQPCRLKDLGCQFEGTASEMEQHSTAEIAPHTNMIVTEIVSLRSGQGELTTKLNNVEERIATLQQNIDTLASNADQSRNVTALQSTIEELRTGFEELKETLNSLVRAADFEPLRQSVEAVQGTMAAQERRLAQVEEGASGARQTVEVSTKVRRLEEMVGTHDIRIAESDLRFRLLETAAFDGRLVWRIPNYTRRKQDAIDGRTLSLYSQPFYSGYYGYKMCARIYLYGDGLGKGTHLSLFFVVMKGEYDALQTWPFKQKVMLSLIDQSGGRKHVTDFFRPDPTSASFRRPVGEMNIASGSPMFAPLSKVESDTYLKDDTIFICVSIDMTDLPTPWPGN